jgi:hypothetical protein
MTSEIWKVDVVPAMSVHIRPLFSILCRFYQAESYVSQISADVTSAIPVRSI